MIFPGDVFRLTAAFPFKSHRHAHPYQLNFPLTFSIYSLISGVSSLLLTQNRRLLALNPPIPPIRVPHHRHDNGRADDARFTDGDVAFQDNLLL
jgi:hypothetical protein